MSTPASDRDADLRQFSGTLVLVGAGKMGGALLDGWLGLGPRRQARRGDRSHIRRRRSPRSQARGIRINPDAEDAARCRRDRHRGEAAGRAEVVPALAPLIGAATVVVSIMAGRTLRFLGDALPGAPRAGARHAEYAGLDRPRHDGCGRGACECGAARSRASPAGRCRRGRMGHRRGADGRCDGGVRVRARPTCSCWPKRWHRPASAAGLPAELAAKLARETVTGSGELLHRSTLDAATLRQNVTSPGGTTAAALDVLMGRDGLASLMTKAIAAATKRSRDLAG